MVAGFTRSFSQTTSTGELVFNSADINLLFSNRGINPPDNTTFRIYIQHKSGSIQTIGFLIPSDIGVVFSYEAQSYSA